MKRRHIILLSWFLSLAILSSLFLIVVPRVTQAQNVGETDGPDSCKITSPKEEKVVEMQIKIPNVTYTFQDEDGKDHHYVKNMACYIAGFYRYFAGVAGILATVMMMYGGIKYVVSFGNPQKIADAKDTIVSALLGFALVLGSYTILYFINPNLTTLKVPGLGTNEAIEQEMGLDWGDIRFCRNLNTYGSAKTCGQPKEFGDQKGCIWVGGVCDEDSNFCIASMIQGWRYPYVRCVTSGQRGHLSLTFTRPGHEEQTEPMQGLRDVECGAIIYDEHMLGGATIGIGLKCSGDNKGCVLFWDDGFYIYQPGDGVMQRGIDNEIGSFVQYECY